ncbi:hypothetical protein BDZ89DRAFT_1120651 [Hymenopellis radicata]|nr:hypothetical protein BDZ89DRAFT_1120651 [Hymenopellis radicata]
MFEAPYPPYDPTDKAGYETVLKRWPIILAGVVDQLHRENHNLFVSGSGQEEKIEEGTKFIEQISRLKYEMARDHALQPIPDDGGAHVATFNTELDRLAALSKNTEERRPELAVDIVSSGLSGEERSRCLRRVFSSGVLHTRSASSGGLRRVVLTRS